ncbi:MAG: M48 family metallopeptidase [Halanaerobiales bacterium]
MEKHNISYNNKELEFELQRKDVKNINLNVRPNMTIMVSANNDVPISYIKDFVKEKAPWIFKKINYFKKTQIESNVQKEYISGESFKYLGSQLRLKVKEDLEEKVECSRDYIYLHVKEKDDYKKKETLLNNWFKEQANKSFNESLNKIYPQVEAYEIKKPKINIRTMKARWGSCIRNKNIITLNFELIKASKYCIEYVILHELLHFKYRNHDKNFYNLMTALMPDWKNRKQILDEEVVRSL